METQAATSENLASSAVKAQYRVTNGPENDRALEPRGGLTVGFDEEFVRNHGRPERPGQRGAPLKYSDMAIQGLLMLKVTFRLTYRALEGFSRSLRQRRSREFEVPDPTHMARRAKGLTGQRPRKNRTEPRHIGVDSTGLKTYGEGEWKVRKHGASKRRRWIKLHWAVEVTTEAWHDGEVFGGLIEQIEGSIEQMDADGAYDTAACDEGAQVAGATWVVPPRENAVPWEEGPPRTEALKQIEAKGREEGKKTGGYPRRSLAENSMSRVKQWLGDRWASRLFQTQVVEAHARGAVMNIMTYLGMPVSVRVGTTFA